MTSIIWSMQALSPPFMEVLLTIFFKLRGNFSINATSFSCNKQGDHHWRPERQGPRSPELLSCHILCPPGGPRLPCWGQDWVWRPRGDTTEPLQLLNNQARHKRYGLKVGLFEQFWVLGNSIQGLLITTCLNYDNFMNLRVSPKLRACSWSSAQSSIPMSGLNQVCYWKSIIIYHIHFPIRVVNQYINQ